MILTGVVSLNQRKSADAIVVPFWQHKSHPVAACNAKEFAALTELPFEAGDFCAKENELLLLYAPKQREKRVILLGLGAEKKCSAETIRRAFATVVKCCHRKKIKHLNVILPLCSVLEDVQIAKAVCEGLMLTNYAYTAKEEPLVFIDKACLIGVDEKSMKYCHETARIAAAVNFARDLVNGNADEITPQALAKEAEKLAKEFKAVKTTVLDKKAIEKEKMGFLLAVGRGASIDPAFIIIEYRGDPHSKERTALIGKGITFDTGGLHIKPLGGMEDQKADMAGAAAVLGAMRAAADIGLKANLIGVIASAENAVGPRSYKPGDVYRGHAGKTVEIKSTDAEGRLVLADALSYVQKKLAPTRMIDLATLTGGVIVALGEEVSGLFSNDDKLSLALSKAGESTYERVWRMPLYSEYKELLKSPIADLKNAGPRKATAICGGIFLKEFVDEKIPWAHLDIAGTAYLSEPKTYHPTLATGVGVRLLIEFLQNL